MQNVYQYEGAIIKLRRLKLCYPIYLWVLVDKSLTRRNRHSGQRSGLRILSSRLFSGSQTHQKMIVDNCSLARDPVYSIEEWADGMNKHMYRLWLTRLQCQAHCGSHLIKNVWTDSNRYRMDHSWQAIGCDEEGDLLE